MPSTRRLQSARTETGRFLLVFLKSLVCRFIRLVGSKGSVYLFGIEIKQMKSIEQIYVIIVNVGFRQLLFSPVFEDGFPV